MSPSLRTALLAMILAAVLGAVPVSSAQAWWRGGFVGPRFGFVGRPFFGPRFGFFGPRFGFVGPRFGFAGPRVFVGPRFVPCCGPRPW
jgi:hypothetical protein